MGKKRRLVVKTNRGRHNLRLPAPYIQRGQGYSLGLPEEYRAKRKAALKCQLQNGEEKNP